MAVMMPRHVMSEVVDRGCQQMRSISSDDQAQASVLWKDQKDSDVLHGQGPMILEARLENLPGWHLQWVARLLG